MGKNILNYIGKTWENQCYVLRQAGFYSRGIKVERGVTQGDTNSPIIFNVVIDVVINRWVEDIYYKKRDALFYAEDGAIYNINSDSLQNDLNIIISLFENVGLRTNSMKTKCMITKGMNISLALSKEKYSSLLKRGNKCKQESDRETKTKCEICKKVLTKRVLKKHMLRVHRIKETNTYETNDSPQVFNLVFEKGKKTSCPKCEYSTNDKSNMYRHFCFRHHKDKIIINNEKHLGVRNVKHLF